MGAYLTYALDDNNKLVHIDDVCNGTACACHCIHCKAPLCAKNSGIQREHHFAHAKGHECEGAYESTLHLLAKEILTETGKIMLPPSRDRLFLSGCVRIHNIEIEKWDDKNKIRPDVEGILDNGERILIEFYVSHKIDSKKRKIIVTNHLKCLEIDINYQALNKAELKDFLINSSEDRRWIVAQPTPLKPKSDSFNVERNPIYEKTRDALKEKFDQGTITIHPNDHSLTRANKSFDLRQYGYDVCEVNTKYRGFKSDLLLYRSQKEDKGYISINIRGRHRNKGYRCPNDLRIMDLILSSGFSSIDIIKEIIEKGDLINSNLIKVEYTGFKQLITTG